MKFIFFSGFIWIVAIFHMWDHRRYERDIARYMDGARDGDWRQVGSDGDEIIKRAFKISTRADIARYAMPVVFFLVWLLVFRFWAPALIYAVIIFAKWFVAQTRVDIASRRYSVYLLGYRVFGARLD